MLTVRNKLELERALSISDMFESNISELLSVILNKPIQVTCTNKLEVQSPRPSYFFFKHKVLGNFGLDLNFIYCLNNDFLFFTRVGLIAAAIQKSELKGIFQIKESIDWSRKVTIQQVNIFGGDNFIECLGTTAILWDGEEINEIQGKIGKCRPRNILGNLCMALKAKLPQEKFAWLPQLEYRLDEVEFEIGINKHSWSAVSIEACADGESRNLNFRIREKNMDEKMDHASEVTLSLGNITIELEDFFHLRSGSEIEFEIPEKFDAALMIGEMVFAKADISIDGSVLKLSVSKVAGFELPPGNTKAG